MKDHTSPSTTSTKRPELLAPVASWEMCLAAVHNGADAIYVGMPDFNARGRTATLALEDLHSIIDYCHLYGVRVLIAFNVLIFQDELEELIPLIRDVVSLSPDALIVQDVGLATLIHFIAPNQPLHASTQMTITSAECLSCVEDLNLKRVVLAREVSLREMEKIRASTPLELESFVHGALCVSYSGQCLTSEALGGRSANRGQCAQACRLEYSLLVDGSEHPLGDRRYLVSPQDLCALEDVPRLLQVGIDSFKIEGRLKSAEYVAASVHAYRNKIDSSTSENRARHNALLKDAMQITYSRGFFNGWLDGVNHQRLVDARYSSHHGAQIGYVVSVSETAVVIESRLSLSPGVGLLFTDFSDSEKLGAKIYHVEQLKGQNRWMLSFGNHFSLSSVKPGMTVFINSSPDLSQDLRKSYSDRTKLKRIPLTLSVRATEGAPLEVKVVDDRGRMVTVCSESPLTSAKSAPLTSESIRNELGALSATPFFVAKYDCHITTPVFLHNRELKAVRRKFCRDMSQIRLTTPNCELKSVTIAKKYLKESSSYNSDQNAESQLNLLVRAKEQLEELRDLKLGTVYLEYEFGKNYADSIQRVRDLGFKAGIATTRIHKPGENGHLRLIERLKPDCVLVRNLGALYYLRNTVFELVGDFSLNITNSLTAKYFLQKNISRFTPSYDLNIPQLLALLKATDASRIEVPVHQYIPSFHMEHCVFAAFLSKGSNYRDCGRPCEKHQVALKDRMGLLHPLRADAECRNTMFHGTPQAAVRLMGSAREQGVRWFRVEALNESASEIREKVSIYSDVLTNRMDADDAYLKLGMTERYGITEGQLVNLRSHRDRKKSSPEIPAYSELFPD